MSVTLSSHRFPLVKELKHILTEQFEFAFYLHAVHSVKLTKIVGVESSLCHLVPRPPTKNCFLCPCCVDLMIMYNYALGRLLLTEKHFILLIV